LHLRVAIRVTPGKISRAGRIKAMHGKRGVCWDLVAWNNRGVAFVECKWKGRDSMKPNEWGWLHAALKVGLPLNNFAIGEWEFEF